LEVDRREVRRRITKLKSELDEVRAHRQRHRLQRMRAGLPTVALVGYTNAGKSTLLNALSGSDIYVADQLFATLDPTTRRVKLPDGRMILFSDTVGFIQKLPVTLVAAFRATLEEVVESDLLLHVVDASHRRAWDQVDVVEDTLAELDASRIPKVLALNKIDLGERDSQADYQSFDYREVIRVSAAQGTGLDELLVAVGRVLADEMVDVSLTLPYSQGDLLGAVHSLGIVREEVHTGQGVQIRARVPVRLAGRLQRIAGSPSERGKEANPWPVGASSVRVVSFPLRLAGRLLGVLLAPLGRRFDSSDTLSSLINQLSSSMATQRGLLLMIGTGLLVVSLLVHFAVVVMMVASGSFDRNLYWLCIPFTLVHAGVLIGFTGAMLAAPWAGLQG
jgi:small GTP-binding protein